MNYEQFYENSNDTLKVIKDRINQVVKFQKSFQKNADKGDVKNLLKDCDSLVEAADNLEKTVQELRQVVSSFDYQTYFTDGEFAEETVSACKDKGIDVNGNYPVYEMFPYKIKFDETNFDLYIDRKKLSSLRPEFVALTIKAGQDKLNSASFDALRFANELNNVYQTYLLKKKLREGTAIGLKNLYKELIPMARFKKEYDEQAFAFDIARLYINLEEVNSSCGFKIQLGTERKGTEIRILDANGKEQLLSSIAIK